MPNTPISSAAVNSDLSDIADALTGSLARDGQGGMTAVLPLANTGFSYLTDPNTGMRRTAADTQAISAGGVDAVTITSTAVDVVALKIAGVTAFPITTAEITDANVTYAKIQNVAASRLIGNPTGAPSAPSEISLGTGLAFAGTTIVASPVSGPVAAASGLVITNNAGTPNSIIDISADQATMVTSTGLPLWVSGFSGSINTSVTGINGLDTLARASSTWYNLFIIGNGTPASTGLLASLSATAPTMPSGYTYLVRVGAMRTDGSGNFLRSRQVGNHTQNLTSAANLPQIATGNQAVTSTAIGNFAPPTAVSIYVSYFGQTNGAGPSYLAAAGATFAALPSTQPYAEMEDGTNTAAVFFYVKTQEIVLQSTNIFVASTGMTTALWLAAGWRDKVNAS